MKTASKGTKEMEFRRRHGGLWIFFGVIVLILLAMSIFFTVTDIEVEGNARYTDEEIILASGLEKGENLFFINRYDAASRIFKKLPYVNDVMVTRELPSRVVISITESSAMGYVTLENDYWVVDQNCKILKKIDQTELKSLIRIDGLVPVDPEEGSIMTVAEEDGAKLRFLSEILNQLLKRGLWTDVSIIDMSDVTNPAFAYLSRFTVRVGEDADLDYKFGLLQSAVEQLAEHDAGTLDLSIDQQVHFSPG